MKWIADILKQFTHKERVLVLVLLLTSILSLAYFKQDDCQPIIQENLKMHEDFLKISQMLREERMKEFTIVHQDTIVLDKDVPPPTIVEVDYMLEIQKIVDSNNK